MNLEIRSARPEDSTTVARLLLLAMEEIVFAFIGTNSKAEALDFMEQMVSSLHTQYSWENAYVATVDGQIIGAVAVYDGSQLHALRAPVAAYITSKYGRPFDPEDETQAGEFYVDTIGVDPKWQGKGIGASLLRFLIAKYVKTEGNTLGLLVEQANPAARRLYEKVGFLKTGEKWLMGKPMDHLQCTAVPK